MERKFQNQCFQHSGNKHWTLRLPEILKLYTTNLLWFSSINPDKIPGEILLETKNLDRGIQQIVRFSGIRRVTFYRWIEELHSNGNCLKINVMIVQKLINGNLTKMESGHQKGAFSFSTANSQLQTLIRREWFVFPTGGRKIFCSPGNSPANKNATIQPMKSHNTSNS